MHKRRLYSAHHTLLRIARVSASKAAEKSIGWRDHEFVAVTMSCLAIEAICNAFGERMVDHWKEDVESASPTLKLRILCSSMGVEYDKNAEPWRTLRKMHTVRNRIAHPKLESVEKSESMTVARYRREERIEPVSSLEKQVAELAQGAPVAVQRLLEVFGEKLSEDDQFDLLHDSWEGTAHPEVTLE
ncbi:hypothetical protein ACFQ0E_02455 [Lysobacter brunescens]|uniref:RiboL-PSP-HEPN domain-containing protein n=1 Tax=Lysobacter brunescens TaxID=262323 RepID=A0ABW2Y933_9GAMM